MDEDQKSLREETVEPPSRTRRGLVIGFTLAASVAVLLAYGAWTGRQRLAAEKSAAETLRELGAIVVLDSERRHVGSVNMSMLQSSEALARALEHLADLTHITALDVSRTPINNAQLIHLAALPNLESLSLNSTAVTDDGVQRLRSLAALQSLYLASTDITDRSLPVIANFKELRMLDLSATKVASHLEPLARSPRLEWLMLRNLSLTGKALPKLGDCPALKRLSLEQSKYSADSLAKLQHARPELSVTQ